MPHRHTPAARGHLPRAAYLTILHEQLERRQRDHGRAFLTPSEDAWLRAQGLRQDRRYADLGQLRDATPARRAASPWSRANG